MHKRAIACFEDDVMMEEYHKKLKEGLQKAYAVATDARKKGYDPADDVEVRITKDVAARVESIVGPPNIAREIRTMEKSGMGRMDIAFEIAKRIAGGEVIGGSKEFLIEQAVRTGVGILTEGVLVAPTEGISKLRIKKNPDGSDYVAVYYAGPIRSAGGTAVALSLVLADIARRVCGVGDYRATDSQVERYVEEIGVYEARVTHLQYYPPEDDIRTIVKNCPICVDGDPTEDVEVSAYKGVPGVETDRIRGGVPLVVCEGVALKAAKVLKYTRKLKLSWNWLEKIIKIKARADRIEIKPDPTYLDGVVAGRPVFSHASAKGGFRLRYGRSETNGLMAKNIHPATMTLLDDFLAYGTHMKIERPGKGCVVAPHSGIEPPVVKLSDGRVTKVRSVGEAEKLRNDVEEILFLGDMLSNYGDFLKSNHPLIPSGYCREIWEKELEEAGVSPPETIDAGSAFEFSKEHNAPLHPDYVYPWHDISAGELKKLAGWMEKAGLSFDGDELKSVVLPPDEAKRILEILLVEHGLYDEKIVIDGVAGYSVLASLGMLKGKKVDASVFHEKWDENKSSLRIVNEASGVRISAWAPSYIGARMGRPEKAKERMMAGKPHVLFPTGSFKNRSLSKQYRMLKEKDRDRAINIELSRFRCSQCGVLTFYKRCHACGGKAKEERACQKCGRIVTTDTHCDMKTVRFDKRPVDLLALFEKVKGTVGLMPEEVKGVKGLSNATRVPERLEKGFLRAKYDVYVFRDGTSRFDATDVTLTHFIPKEIGITAEKAVELGYGKDYGGNRLENDEQRVPLFPQDIVLSENGAIYLMRVANFVDELLVNLYGMRPFYNIRKKEDLIGHFCLGLSPHTSASVVCRIIGFTKANVGYGHPYFHTAKRRNCFYPNTKILVWNEDKGKQHAQMLGQITEEIIKKHPEKVKRLDRTSLKVDAPPNLYVFSIEKTTKKIIKKRIQCFIKVESPEYWIKITTENKKEVTVTPDHNVLYSKNGKLKSALAEDIKLNMEIPVSSDRKIYRLEKIEKIEKISDGVAAYCLDIETKNKDIIEKNIMLANGLFSIRCDGDEDSIMLLLDALLNFSRKYLDEKRGGTMDSPLVLTTVIDPKEVDDESHSIEIVSSYPLEFYRAAEKITPPGDVKLKTIKNVLGEDEQYDFPLTHPGTVFSGANTRTAYVKLETIPEKISTQFNLQERIRAVDEKDAASRLILSHFIPDLYGNLRSYSRQTFRCVSCNTIYRRVPLVGKCTRCGGNLILTINKGGIEKYLQISRDIVERYELPEYTKQRLELIEKEIHNIFEDEKQKQMGLSDFL